MDPMAAVPKDLLWDYMEPPPDILWRLQRIADFFSRYGTDRETVALLQDVAREWTARSLDD